MLTFTHTFVSRLPDVSCLFGPLTPDGGLPVQVSSRCGQHRLTLMLDRGRLQDSGYCDTQAVRVRRSLNVR